MLAFRRKIIEFNVLFAAITLQVKETNFELKETRFQLMNFGVLFCRNYLWRVKIPVLENFDEKSTILACFFPQLPSACQNSGARISTKIIDFGVLFAAITFGVSKC